MKRFLDHYAGFVAVAIEWIGLTLCLLVHPINWREPGSQYGYYTDTRFIFGLTFTLASVAIIIFAHHLVHYWQYALYPAIASGIFFSLTGWIKYAPETKTLIFDFHNFSITTTSLLYIILIFAMSHQKRDRHIAKVSSYSAIILTLSIVATLVARLTNHWVLGAQVIVLLICQAWILLVNRYIIHDEPWAKKLQQAKLVD